MFDWLGDLFNEDTFKTIIDGANTVGSAFNAVKPLINTGAQLGLGIEGTQNAAAFRAANQQVLNRLNDMFGPTGEYAGELRKQMERKDAAAGRRSQYGTRETELMTNLAKQRSSVLTSPAYQNFLLNANRSNFAPIAGAVGNLTGGLTGDRSNTGVQGGSGKQMGANALSNASSVNTAGQYLSNLFGPGAEMSIASGIGGAGSALGASPEALGIVDSLGSLLGGQPFLPGYTGTASGIFGPGASGIGGATAGAAPEGGAGLLGSVGSGLDLLGGAGAFGGAGGALSGMGAGSLAGTVGGADALGGLLGGTGFLPSYGAAGGTTATGLFGGAAAEAAGAGAGAAAGGGGGAGGAAAAGVPAYGAALPIAVLIGGLMSMFNSGTQPGDISSQWMNNVNAAGGKNMTADQFGQIRGEQPTLNALLDLSMNNGVFDINKYNEALGKATVGGKRFEGDALTQAQNFGNFAAQNPGLMGTPASGQGTWWEQAAQQYGGG